MADPEAEDTEASRYSDEDLLRLVGNEIANTQGFGLNDGGDLMASRERAHQYVRGEMPDVPSLPGRSAVVDTTISDAVQTLLPDLMEVFFGGDDVVTFAPDGEDDEDRADEESEAVKYIIFTLNAAMLHFTTAFQDALLDRLGLFHWWWEDSTKETSCDCPDMQTAQVQHMQISQEKPWSEIEADHRDDGSVALTIKEMRGKICFRAVPPEDFGAASDTVELRDTAYCVMRDRPQVQELIRRGVDKDKARALPRHMAANQADQTRDADGERRNNADSEDDLRRVEVRAHYLRIDMDDDGDPELWRIITDAEQSVILHKEQASHIPFGPLTPYLTSHRLIGRSLADVLFELQRIKTALWRAHLDSIYFALNQRMEVADSAANEFTIADLLANEPGRPIRVKTPGAITAVAAGALNVDTLGSLEYASTVAEMRSGVVRNAQGLNPDTLHDTKGGMMQLVAAAQKRTRFIARVFAETGVKDLALGVRQLMKENHDPSQHAPNQMRLGPKKWKSYDPTQWADTREVTVHVGIGSAGKDHDMMVANQRLQIIEQLVPMPGAMGTLIDPTNINHALLAWERAAGSKSPEQYWTDPKSEQAQQAQQAASQRPDPDMAKAQADMKLRQAQAQADTQLAQQKAQADVQLQATKHQNEMQAAEAQAARDHELQLAKIQTDGELKRHQIEQELQLKRETTAAELQMKRELLTAELQMKRETAYLNADVARETGLAKAEASSSVSEVEPGGDPG